jgi:hypothetical protein
MPAALTITHRESIVQALADAPTSGLAELRGGAPARARVAVREALA